MREVLVRQKLRDKDNSQAYPFQPATGGSPAPSCQSFFDDTRTVVYATASLVSFPTTLPSGYKNLAADLQSDIFITSRTSIFASDDWVEGIPAHPPIAPYKEVGQFEQDIKSSHFYLTGSDPSDVGLGFDQQIGSKTLVRLEFPVAQKLMLNPLTASINYFNPTIGAFQTVGELTPAKIANASLSLRYNGAGWDAKLFGPFGNLSMSGSVVSIFGDLHPHPFYTGVTNAVRNNLVPALQFIQTQSVLLNNRYAATSSQIIDLTGVIKQPFLIEKIMMEVPFVAGPGWFQDRTLTLQTGGSPSGFIDIGGPCVTFALMNQLSDNKRDLILSATVIPSTDNISEPRVFGTTRYAGGFLSYGTPSAVVYPNNLNQFTGSVVMQTEALVTNGLIAFDANNSQNVGGAYYIINISPFGRAMNTEPCGRSVFGKDFTIPNIVDFNKKMPRNAELFGPRVSPVTTDATTWLFDKSAKSPYLLYPGDKLVLSVTKHRSICVDPNAYQAGGNSTLSSSHDVGINTGMIRLTMYGSLIKNSAEFHEITNQQVVTNAVHETLKFGDHIIDQFETEYLSAYSGTYIDNVVTGSTRTLVDRGIVAHNTNPNEKNSLHQLGLGEANTPPRERCGFIRGGQFISENERFFDTMLPSINDVAKVNGSSFGVGFQNFIFYILDLSAIGDFKWTKTFPFEPRYSALKRTLNQGNTFVVKQDIVGNPITPFTSNQVVIYSTRSDGFPSLTVEVFSSSSISNPKADDVTKAFFGIGDISTVVNTGGVISGTLYGPDFRYLYKTGGTVYSAAPIIRGWKYGILNGLPEFSKSIYRVSKYGQFRDVLEQRKDSKFFDTIGVRPNGSTGIAPGQRSSVVSVFFVNSITHETVKPEKTYSSNLSYEATSSLPFFDNMVKNRENPISTVGLLGTIVGI